MITAERAREVLVYNPDTGGMLWRISRKGVVAGAPVGSVDPGTRYLRVRIDYKLYYVHRLAVLIMTGRFPSARTDHRDLDKLNNKWENIREANSTQNQGNRGLDRNNTSGFKGVSWCKERGMWEAYITINCRKKNLGRFDKKEDAAAAYWTAAQKHFGEFARAA